MFAFLVLDLKHLMKHEKHVQKRKRAEGEFTIPPPQPVINLPTIRLPASEVPTSSTATRHQPMVVRLSTSFYPSCPEYFIYFMLFPLLLV